MLCFSKLSPFFINAKYLDHSFFTHTDLKYSGFVPNTTITFAEFQKALDEIAKKKGTTKEAIENQIKSHGGATYTGTKADYVKFHDDKSTYTGVYAKGGPSVVDAGRGGMVSDISQTCNRQAADVRGVLKK